VARLRPAAPQGGAQRPLGCDYFPRDVFFCFGFVEPAAGLAAAFFAVFFAGISVLLC
jgi:hypothetical protein